MIPDRLVDDVFSCITLQHVASTAAIWVPGGRRPGAAAGRAKGRAGAPPGLDALRARPRRPSGACSARPQGVGGRVARDPHPGTYAAAGRIQVRRAGGAGPASRHVCCCRPHPGQARGWSCGRAANATSGCCSGVTARSHQQSASWGHMGRGFRLGVGGWRGAGALSGSGGPAVWRLGAVAEAAQVLP
jgi:hypothetical protein